MSLPEASFSESVWVTEDDVVYDGPFRTNVSAFLGHFGARMHMENSSAGCWTVKVQERAGDEQETVELHVYEESAQQDSPTVCDQCRIIGWQQHPVCTRRYHFIIPTDPSASPLALYTGQGGPSKWPLAVLDPDDDPHSSLYTAPVSIFDSKAHLLHGVLHLNGYGHLLRINGVEGGSTKLTGRQIMGIWDKLCALLRARKVSVEDVSNKGGMELRVLHAAAHRTTWYGRWGYAFGRGAFNIMRKNWRQAVEAVHSAPMSAITADFQAHKRDSAVLYVIERYQALVNGWSGPATLGTFLQRMLLCLSQPDAAAWVLGLPNADPPAALIKGAATRGARVPCAVPQAGRKRGRDALEGTPAAGPAAMADKNAAANAGTSEIWAQASQGPAGAPAAVQEEGVTVQPAEAPTTATTAPRRTQESEAQQGGEPAAEKPNAIEQSAMAVEGNAPGEERFGEPGAGEMEGIEQGPANNQPSEAPTAEEDPDRQLEAGNASSPGGVDAVGAGRSPSEKNHQSARSGKKGKGDGIKKERGAVELMAVRSNLKPLKLDKLPDQFPPDDAQDCLSLMIALLKEHSEVWMRRAVLRSLVMKQGKEAALVDSLLKAVADATTEDFAIFRQVDPRTKTMYFMWGPAAGEDSKYPVDHRQPAAVLQAQRGKRQHAPAATQSPDVTEAAQAISEPEDRSAELRRPTNATVQDQRTVQAFQPSSAPDGQQGDEQAAVDLPRDRPSSCAAPSQEGLVAQRGTPAAKKQPSSVIALRSKLIKGAMELPALRRDLQPLQLGEMPQSWAPDRVEDCLDFLLAKLKEDSGIWIRRTVLRAMALQQGKSAVIIDFLLKHIQNRTTQDLAVFRQMDVQLNVNYYMAGSLQGEEGVMYPVDLRQPADILKAPIQRPPAAVPACPVVPNMHVEPRTEMQAAARTGELAEAGSAVPHRDQDAAADTQQGAGSAALAAHAAAADNPAETAGLEAPSRNTHHSELLRAQPAAENRAQEGGDRGTGQGDTARDPDSLTAEGQSNSQGGAELPAATEPQAGMEGPRLLHVTTAPPDDSTAAGVTIADTAPSSQPSDVRGLSAAPLAAADELAQPARSSGCATVDGLRPGTIAESQPALLLIQPAEPAPDPQQSSNPRDAVAEPAGSSEAQEQAVCTPETPHQAAATPPDTQLGDEQRSGELEAIDQPASALAPAAELQQKSPEQLGEAPCLEDQESERAEDRLTSIQPPIAAETEDFKVPPVLLSKVPKRAPNGRFLTMAVRKSLAAQLGTSRSQTSKQPPDISHEMPAVDAGPGREEATGGAEVVAEPTILLPNGVVEPPQPQLAANAAEAQPDGAPDGPVDGGVDQDTDTAERVTLDQPSKVLLSQAALLANSSDGAAALLEEGQRPRRALRSAARSGAGVQTASVQAAKGPGNSVAGPTGEAVNSPLTKGKRTHKGKPAAVFPKGPVWRELEPSGTRPAGNVDPVSRPAGPWGTKAVRSTRNGATPVKPTAAGAWQSSGLAAQLQDTAAKTEGTTACKPDATVAQRPASIGKPADTKLLKHQAAEPAEQSGLQALPAEAAPLHQAIAGSEPGAAAVSTEGLAATVPVPEGVQHAGGQPRRKRTLSGRLLTTLDGGTAQPMDSAANAGANGPIKGKRKRSEAGTGQKRQRVYRTAAAAAASTSTETPPKPWQLLKPGAPFTPKEGVLPRDQVMCDLVHFFNAVLRLYEPAAVTGMLPPGLAPVPVASPATKATGAGPRMQSRPSTVLEAPRLAKDVAILRDTRHFVKDYQGNNLAPGASEPSAESSVRLLCHMEPLDFTTLGQPSTQAAPATSGKPNQDSAQPKHPRGKLVKRLRVVLAPPELVVVTPRTTLKQLRLAAQKAFRDVYKMFENVEILNVEGLTTPETKKGRVGTAPDGTMVTLHGQGADPQTCWHHAGGEEDWVVSCSCGTKDDDGERMVACDSCGLWMHLRCQGVPDSAPLPNEFVCARCSKKGSKARLSGSGVL